MTDAPPVAKLFVKPGGPIDWGWKPLSCSEVWACYYCESIDPFLVISLNPDHYPAPRMVVKCDDCGRHQVVGTREDIRQAAIAAARAIGDPECDSDDVSERFLSDMREAYNKLYWPSQTKVADELKVNRKSKKFKAAWAKLGLPNRPKRKPR